MRAAAAAIGVTPMVIRRWIDRGDLSEPPWPLEELRRLHAEARPSPGAQADHGTLTRYAMGCDCDACLTAQREYQRGQVRAKAQQRFPHDLRQQLLDALVGGAPFKEAIAGLGLSSRRVWGLAQHDQEWSQALDEVLRATRDPALRHGTAAAYARGCVCRECRDYPRERRRRSRSQALPDRGVR